MKMNSLPKLRKRTTKRSEADWAEFFSSLRSVTSDRPAPSLNLLTDAGSSPWQILVSTILSLRTRDEVTLSSSRRLFAVAPDPPATRGLTEELLAKTIFPVGFYKTKARQILQTARLLESKGDQVPSTKEGLLQLPGVGPKTANLVLNLAFATEAICVDTHVHRIPNRLGWIQTATVEDSEVELERLWPRRHWIEANELFVAFGQTLCQPVSPWCSRCPFSRECLRVGVKTSR